MCGVEHPFGGLNLILKKLFPKSSESFDFLGVLRVLKRNVNCFMRL